MPFPPFSTPLGAGLLIGLDAVIHVLISHGVAIGVVGMVVLLEYFAHRRGLEEWERFSHRLIRFSAIIITAVGAVTGVGIWFITSVVAPRSIGSMLRIFFWPWFIEWGVFVGELLVLLVFYYYWDCFRQRKGWHAWLGGSYVVLAIASAALITGILAFMMTSGGWPASESFTQAFFNPTFIPQFLLRICGAFGLGALFSLGYLFFTEAESPFRRTMAALFGRVLLVALAGTAVCCWWYFSLVPPNFKIHIIAAVMPKEYPKDPHVFWAVNLLSLAVLVVFSLLAQRKTGSLTKALIVPALVLAIGFTAEFEYIREFIRGPYLMPGFMYANQLLVREGPYLAKKGLLKTSYWYGSDSAGAFLFQANCGSCHTLNGVNSITARVHGRSEDGINAMIGHTHEMIPWMAPFSGTGQERRTLAHYLYARANGGTVVADKPNPPAARLSDLLLPRPISAGWRQILLFAGFTLHLLFALFTTGTVMLGVYYYNRSRRLGPPDVHPWHYDILHRFMALKSGAIMMGVAPLLLIQIGYTVSFFTAINVLGPYWILIIVFLILASLAFDIIGQYRQLPLWFNHTLVVAGIVLLLAIPGIFVGVLTVTENAQSWLPMLHGGHLPAALSVHWLVRYLHVLGAGIVFGAALHYILTKRQDAEQRASLRRFVWGGLLYQIAIGWILYLTLPRHDRLAMIVLVLGVVASVMLLGVVLFRRVLPPRAAPALLAVILLGMLLTRQLQQARGVAPVEHTTARTTVQYRRDLAPYRQTALAAFQQDQQTVYDNGATIYSQACAFCHGTNGRGTGVEAAGLAIPPENLTAIRVKRPYLTKLITGGVPGTGMPYFSVYSTDSLDKVVDELDARYHLLDAPSPVPVPVSPDVSQQARAVYAQNCATCHRLDGRGDTWISRKLIPPPPDFTQYTLQPDAAFAAITNGYPGTGMSGFPTLPREVRWGLVEQVQWFYGK